MRIRKTLLVAIVLAVLLMTVGVGFWLARDPVDTLIATIKKEYVRPPWIGEECPIALQIEQAGLGNRAAPRVLQLLDDDDPEIRKRAAEALAQIGADSSLIVPKLLEKRFDPDPSVRKAVLWALARARPPSDAVIDLFLERTKDKDPEVRIGAACTLTYMWPQAKRTLPMILPIFITALDDTRSKSAAAEALGRIGAEARDAISILRIMATSDSNEYDRTVAIAALRKIEGDSDSVISALIDLLKCDYPYARSYAARTLGGIGPRAERAIPALQYILDNPPTKNPSPPPPPAAPVKAPNSSIFGPTTGTVGLATLENTYPQVREEVIEALRKIKKTDGKGEGQEQ
jgi:HEAT repeat protein